MPGELTRTSWHFFCLSRGKPPCFVNNHGLRYLLGLLPLRGKRRSSQSMGGENKNCESGESTSWGQALRGQRYHAKA